MLLPRHGLSALHICPCLFLHSVLRFSVLMLAPVSVLFIIGGLAGGVHQNIGMHPLADQTLTAKFPLVN